MKIAVASGKGGTGKTTLAINLALSAARPVCLLDCDVEEPNAHIFLQGAGGKQHIVTIPVPEVDESLCDGCGLCGQFCQFNAIVSFGTTPIIAQEMCHGCGGCARVCPNKAIHEIEKCIGVIKTSQAGAINLIQGQLDIGSPLSPPLIRAVKKEAVGDLIILDAPPGTSCPVIATIRDVDYVILVTEPTPFGLNDLKLAVEVARKLDIPFGVVINRAAPEDNLVRPYLSSENIRLLAEIPDDRRIAEAYAKGLTIVETLPEYKDIFTNILKKIGAAK